jgi:hypothetical protein
MSPAQLTVLMDQLRKETDAGESTSAPQEQKEYGDISDLVGLARMAKQ